MPSALLSTSKTSGTTLRARRRASRRGAHQGCSGHAAHVLRFQLPDAGPFARVSIELDLRSYLFVLRCYRRDAQRALVLATTALNRFRLRELEDTLVELRIGLPPALRRFLVATLSDDAGTVEAFLPRVRSMMCCHPHQAEPQQITDVAV